MKGTILDYTVQGNKGVITAENGERYTFGGEQWKAPGVPLRGQRVDFVPQEGSQAADVYLQVGAASATSGEKSKITAALLAFFLGYFGAHKFYLGYTSAAWTMLLVWTFGWLLFAIPSIVIGIIAFIEFIIYISKSDAEFEQIYVQNKKHWF